MPPPRQPWWSRRSGARSPAIATRSNATSRRASPARPSAPDARGHGASDKPHERSAYAWDTRVSDIEAVMDDLDVESAHIWGYSMGGVYAFGLVRRVPARVRTAIIGGAHPYAASWSAFHGVDGTDPQLFLTALESFVGVLPPEVRARVLNKDFQ